MTATSVKNLEEVIIKYNFQIKLNNSDNLSVLKNILGDSVIGRSNIKILTMAEDHIVEISLADSYNLNSTKIEEILALKEIDEVVEF